MRLTIPEPIGQLYNRLKSIRFRANVAAIVTCAAVVLVAAVVVARIALPGSDSSAVPAGPDSTELVRYLGVYEPGAPSSYAGVEQFAQAIGRQPNIVMYYGSWGQPFQASFAASAAEHGAVTLVQIGTGNISLASIASGGSDGYLRAYADEVKEFGGRTILSLDHEMNGDWYPWGDRHTSPATFIAAWRHVVTIFREQGATNVTWMWTVNITDSQDNHIPGPAAWWPGSSYVNWVGIDGYYYGWDQTFASLFGQTITDVRELTRDPILIAETGAALSAGQPAKISDLFNGVRVFGLLGFVLFDENGVSPDVQTWRISSDAAYAALRRGVKAYMRPTQRADP